MCNVGPKEHCRPLFTKLKILTVINLYIYVSLIHVKNNITDFYTREYIHHHDTRGKTNIDIPRHRLTKTGNSHKINCLKFFNKLPHSAFTTTFNNFKNKLYNWLAENPFYSMREFFDVCNIEIEF